VSVKLLGPFFFFFFFFFGFCFVWQLLHDKCIMHQVHTSVIRKPFQGLRNEHLKYLNLQCMSICLSVRAVSRHCPNFCFSVFFFVWSVLFSVSIKLPGPLLFFIFIYFILLMGFVFCDSYYSTGALCTRFTLVYSNEGNVSQFILQLSQLSPYMITFVS
jgi:hypothetical protein